jgi:glycosyltransferase involved in cell wall biosynthesis
MRTGLRVCLISSVHPWVNPRLIKEADALAAAGHDPVVVTKSVAGWAEALDARLLATKRWPSVRVDLRRDHPAARWRWLTTAVRGELAARAYRVFGALRCAEEGYYRGFGPVLDAARRTDADLFIAHTQGALPIAARAAATRGVPYGFDCEDLLAEEAADGLRNRAQRQAILDIERAYLPGAAYVTATSEAMATYLARTYGISPHVVRNVFPLAELHGITPPGSRPRRASLELVWISATIGPGRGLEDALQALAQLPDVVRLTLFGRVLPAYEASLNSLVARLNVANRVSIQPLHDPSVVMATIARFDIGLTLDLNDCLNRSLTICNKVFLYLQAGLLVAATDTPGQREIIGSMPGAGFLYPSGDAGQLAARLLPFVNDRTALREAQTAAWDAGQERYNWDRDRTTFLAAFHQAANLTPTASRFAQSA